MSALAGLALATALAPPLAGGDDETRGALLVEHRLSEHRFADVDGDGDGASELVTVSARGEVRTWSFDAPSARFVPAGDALLLTEPEHTALSIADVLPDAGLELCVLDRRGAFAHPWSSAGWRDEPTPLTRTGRLSVRLGRPTFAPFTTDVNADGALDLVVPAVETCQLFLRAGPEPTYELAQTLPLRLVHERETTPRHLASELRSSLRIQGLDIADLNGDGRPDLRVREGRVRRYHLQDTSGRFSSDPIRVDLGTFRDTTPRADVQPGETLVVSDEPQLSTGDLNGDGIPDYVVAHRRKVWSFLAGADGPQFEESSIRLVAEGVSALLLVDLNDDGRDDLLVFKLDVPSTAELILGVVRSIDAPLRVLGYPTAPDGTFETRARWKSELVVRIPSLLRLLREAEDIVERFREVVRKFRWSATGDFDGDGAEDLALFSEDESSVELWLRPPDPGERFGAGWLRGLLFEEDDTTFDVERVLKLAAEVFDGRTSELTSERAADARVALERSADEYLIDVSAPDLTGDGKAELVLVESDADGCGRRRFSVVPLAPE